MDNIEMIEMIETIDQASDFHMHTQYSDGSASVLDMAESAVQKGLRTISITDHMPLPYQTHYAMDINKIDAYRQDIKSARKIYSGRLDIKTGLEFEYIPEKRSWIESIVNKKWDYLLVSIHSLWIDDKPYLVNGNPEAFEILLNQVFHGDIRSICRLYYQSMQEAVGTGFFDCVGHFDVAKKHNKNQRIFNESESWYVDLVLETLNAIKQQGMKMEINTGGFGHPVETQYPSNWILKEALKLGVPLVYGSDSHNPGSLGQFFDIPGKMISDFLNK